MTVFSSIKKFLQDRFNLHEDKADENLIVASIRGGVHFRGTNLWTLIFAIFIASIGLNVNSTAVIIGAMLISPLMGPIMAIGLGLGINDFDLLNKGLKNLAIAAFISVVTSGLYFLITPLHEASSELLARTNPSLLDVFIAFFGGLAGIVAGTRKEKTNVIPGVAIATALMPPLCTAGYGLANSNWYFMLGALYLFFINSLFICLASFLIVKHLRFKKIEISERTRAKRVQRWVYLVVIMTILPSIYLTYRIVEQSIFEGNAKNFVQGEFHFQKTQVVSRNFKKQGSKQSIELLLIGRELSENVIDSLRRRMKMYGLDSTQLVIHQGLDAKREIDLAQVKASILEDVFREEKTKTMEKEDPLPPYPDISAELRALYPEAQQYSISPVIIRRLDTTVRDTLTLFTASFNNEPSAPEKRKLARWLKERIRADSIKILIE